MFNDLHDSHRQRKPILEARCRAAGKIFTALLVFALGPFASGACVATAVPGTAPRLHPGQAEFVAELVREAQAHRPGLDAKEINGWLALASYQPRIIEAISKPAEAKPWHAYRPLFLTEERIDQGVRFWRQHAALLAEMEKKYAVPAEIVVAILGVETFYGRNTGSWRVLDALTTLTFYYPPRASYFRQELKRFLLSGDAFPAAIDTLKGSYAGAMGWGQFMPTSYRTWAVDGDHDQRIDLWNSPADIIFSVGSYLMAHGWKPGEPIAALAQVRQGARVIRPENLNPVYSVAQLREWGYVLADEPAQDAPATLLRLEVQPASGAEAEFWVIYSNFSVLATYNRSPLYCMAVYQLAQALSERHGRG